MCKMDLSGRSKLLLVVATQVLLNITYFVMSISLSVQGPTLLDLADIYSSDIETISLSLTVGSVCDIASCFLTGYVMRQFFPARYIVVFLLVFLLGASTALIPSSGGLGLFFLVMSLSRFANGGLQTALTALCLELWRSSEWAGAIMQSLHFSSSLGGVAASLYVKGFIEGGDAANATAGGDSDVQIIPMNHNLTTMLYLNVGILFFVLSSFYFLLSCFLWQKSVAGDSSLQYEAIPSADAEDSDDVIAATAEEHAPQSTSAAARRILIGLSCAIGCTFMTFERAISSFMPASAVLIGDLHASKQDGADAYFVFNIMYTASRALGVLLALKIRANIILVLDLALLLAGSAVLTLPLGHADLTWFKAGYGTCGFGMGSLFALLFVFLEQYVVVDSQVTGIIFVCSGVGTLLPTLIVGQTIDLEPLSLIYLQLSTAFLVTVFFAASLLTSRVLVHVGKVRREGEGEDKEE